MDFVCKKCGEVKDRKLFIENKATRYGIVYTCRECSNKEKHLYYRNNREKMLKYFKDRYPSIKQEREEYRKEYSSSKHGKIMQIIQNIRRRCEDTENKRYHRYGGRGIKNLLTYDDISNIWDRDNASSLKKPSLDRIDVNGNYEVSNCQFIEMRDNSRKDFVKKVAQYTKDDVLIKIWDAIVDTEKDGFQRPNIIKCCKGERSSHKGFKWKYV